MKAAIQTRPWGPEMNRERLSNILAEIAQVGYAGFEIGAQHLDITRPESLRRLAARHKLAVVGVHVGGEIYDPQSVQKALDNLQYIVAFAAQVGAPFLPFSGQPRPGKSAQELQQQATALNQIGQLCHEAGVVLCYHNHFWEIENDCAELRFLCEHTEPSLVSLCLDVGWVKRAGASPVSVAHAFEERIAYFHLKDTRGDEWLELGRGTVDFPGLFEIIRKRQDPWLVVEQDETRLRPIQSAHMSLESLRGWITT